MIVHPGDEIWVVAPAGFRPSQWVEMLIDFDEAYELDPHLIDRRRTEEGECLVMSVELLDPAHPLAQRHNVLLLEMVDKIARMGLTVRLPGGLGERYPAAWADFEKICLARRVLLELPTA